jgi:hypothetical protein
MFLTVVPNTAALVAASSPSFWDQLWPALVATIAGVVVGVPVALQVNAAIAARAARAAEAEARKRLVAGLIVVTVSLEANVARLKDISETVGAGRAPFDAGLDTARWDAVRDEVVEHLDDPDLKGRLASHFAGTEVLARLLRMYLDLVAGMAATLEGSQVTRQALAGNLIQRAGALEEEARRLIAELDEITGGVPLESQSPQP